MRTAIRGIGIAGGFGCGVDKLQQALISGETTPKTIPVEANGRKIDMPVFLCNTTPLEGFVNKRALRRVDHYSSMAVLGSYLALEDAGMLQNNHHRMAVVIATGYGATRTTFSFLDSIIADGDTCASPTLFSNSVHNAAAAHVSIILKANGPNLTVSQFELSVPSALLSACQWLEDGQIDAVLFGGVDEYCDVLGYSWQRFFGSNQNPSIEPLNWDSQSAIAGEGSAFFLLTRDDGDQPKYGFITDIQIGHVANGGPDIAEDALLFLGADGHKSCGSLYPRHIPQGTRAASYTPLYGSFPVNTAFDMAIAALSLKENKIFATPKGRANQSGLRMSDKEQDFESKLIGCLKFGCSGEFGMVMLAGD
jgi:3-oxoacyl-[acyl-carrier-protein] synthase II